MFKEKERSSGLNPDFSSFAFTNARNLTLSAIFDTWFYMNREIRKGQLFFDPYLDFVAYGMSSNNFKMLRHYEMKIDEPVSARSPCPETMIACHLANDFFDGGKYNPFLLLSEAVIKELYG